MKPSLRTIRGWVYEKEPVRVLRMKPLKLDFEYGETLYIGDSFNWKVCCIRCDNEGQFYLWPANSTASDIRISKDEFLKCLASMLSVELLNKWVDKIENKVKLEACQE